MLYDVDQVAEFSKVSQATIYRKIKLKEIEPFVVKKQGKTYVTEEGLHEIAKIINANLDENIDPKEAEVEKTITTDTVPFQELLNAKEDIITSLKEQLAMVKDQLATKDLQLASRDKLFENMQVLLQQEQNKKLPQLLEQQEDRDIRLVNTLLDAMERRKHDSKEEEQKKRKGLFGSLFGGK